MSSANFKPKRTAAASRGFLATAPLLVHFNCMYGMYVTDGSSAAVQLATGLDRLNTGQREIQQGSYPMTWYFGHNFVGYILWDI